MPVIGMTTYLEAARWGAWDMPAALVPSWYLDMMSSARAKVLLIAPGQGPDVLDAIQGLVMIGGPDVEARRYGAESHLTADSPREARDQTEFALYMRARELQMPVLGICRGLQVMAVAHGGNLVQHLPEISTLVHREQPGSFVDHEASFTSGSRLGSIYGTAPVKVNSSHHQCVDSPGELVVTGLAADGTVEACEDPRSPFCIGVQWHPEHPDRRLIDAPLIEAFVSAAADFRSAITVG
jgi:putative glutamine amidotransferase